MSMGNPKRADGVPARSAAAELAEVAALAGARAMVAEIASGRRFEATRKEDFTFVLNLDLLSNAAIMAVLKDFAPHVSEEEPGSHVLLGSTSLYFLVDPLDGTNNCRRALTFFGPALHPMQESFGPIVGVVDGGEIVAATYVSLTDGVMWSAVKGQGCFVASVSLTPGGSDSPLKPFLERERIIAAGAPKLRECGVLFYPGKRGELELLTKLRHADLVDGCYRFGGFAGDCTRVARGREQLLIQFSLKPWDLSAGLIATEAGAVPLALAAPAAPIPADSSSAKGGLRRLSALRAYPMERLVFVHKDCVDEFERALT
jgi:fructose-1,6-bisphosphatase/inositol monophosphatase family enzyme